MLIMAWIPLCHDMAMHGCGCQGNQACGVAEGKVLQAAASAMAAAGSLTRQQFSTAIK